MSLKNILIVVSEIERSKKFYSELFGLQVLRDFDQNVIMTEGLVLQEKQTWEQLIKENTEIGNASELYFEEQDFDVFLEKAEGLKVTFIGKIRENSWGKRVVMIKDPDGHIIEVAEG